MLSTLSAAGASQQRRSTSARFRQDDHRPEASPEVVEAVDPTPQQQAAHDAPYQWREQWYPVHYAADLPEGQPQRVWLFDEAIVVARRPGMRLVLSPAYW